MAIALTHPGTSAPSSGYGRRRMLGITAEMMMVLLLADSLRLVNCEGFQPAKAMPAQWTHPRLGAPMTRYRGNARARTPNPAPMGIAFWSMKAPLSATVTAASSGLRLTHPKASPSVPARARSTRHLAPGVDLICSSTRGFEEQASTG
jgi:hypothetical protein